MAADPPPRLVLSIDQAKVCSKALKLLNKQQTPKQIDMQFSELQSKLNTEGREKLLKNCNVARDPVHLVKNRHGEDGIPFDKNRVKLCPYKDYNPPDEGYINASLIKTSSSSGNITEFIATQGPLPDTCEDFWEMVIQHSCPVIVMLTRLVENLKIVKCEDYFQAEDGPLKFGNICIVTKSIRTTNTSLVLRNLQVYRVLPDKEPPRSVLHIQYPEWPDQGVPSNTRAVCEIFKMIYTVPPQGPVVVHCSAGIGRTGAYIAIHNTIERIVVGDISAVDIAETVATLRSERFGMVQTMAQYEFCIRSITAQLKEFNGVRSWNLRLLFLKMFLHKVEVVKKRGTNFR